MKTLAIAKLARLSKVTKKVAVTVEFFMFLMIVLLTESKLQCIPVLYLGYLGSLVLFIRGKLNRCLLYPQGIMSLAIYYQVYINCVLNNCYNATLQYLFCNSVCLYILYFLHS